MLMVTENARRHLKRLLMTSTGDPNLGIRLKTDKGMQFGVLIDRKADNDYVVEHEGMKVMMIGPELFSLVNNAILDTRKDGSVEKLVITKGDQQSTRKDRRRFVCKLG